MQQNTTKAKLQAGETVFGCFIRYPDATLAEVLALLGWDFLVIDAEHATIEPRDCEQMVRAAELRGVTPIVRATTNLAPTILRFMDSGAHGALIPWVNSAAEAEAAVRAIKYWPRGVRGLAGVRANDYGLSGGLGDYVAKANAETLVVVQIESTTAHDNIEEIAAVEDIDVIFIGPNDLAHSMGLPGQVRHPDVVAAMEHIGAVVGKSKAVLGLMATNAADAIAWQQRGARFITIGMDTLLAPAVRGYLSTVREGIGG
jgi:4-hydroxy-2-oxoheptanedioate aldolase